MTKKLNTAAITNDLEGSAFFPRRAEPQAAKQKSAVASPRGTTTDESGSSSASISPQKTPKQASRDDTNDDVIRSSRHDVKLRAWRDIIENTETQSSALRLTSKERYDVEDVVSELRRKYKVKTSMNELARLGLIYLVDDFKTDKDNALIIKVKKS